jgi:hypothetical protein
MLAKKAKIAQRTEKVKVRFKPLLALLSYNLFLEAQIKIGCFFSTTKFKIKLIK